MTIIDINWVVEENICARSILLEQGLSLSKSKDERKKVAKKIRREILNILDAAWQNEPRKRKPLKDVSKGLYIISLGGRLAINYKLKGQDSPSPVVYIGQGNIHDRLRSHLVEWLLDMSDELNDIKITVHMAEHNQYIDAESLLISEFEKKNGEKPIWNYNAGKTLKAKKELSENSLVPVLHKYKKYKWAIRPLPSSWIYFERQKRD